MQYGQYFFLDRFRELFLGFTDKINDFGKGNERQMALLACFQRRTFLFAISELGFTVRLRSVGLRMKKLRGTEKL